MPTPSPSITDSLGGLLSVLQQAQNEKFKRAQQQGLAYQSMASGDYDVARANDLAAVSRAMGPFSQAVASNGLEDTLKHPEIVGPLVAAFKTPAALNLFPGTSPDQRMSFMLADGKMPTKENAFSISDRDQVAQRDALATQANEVAKAFNTPTTTPAGATTSFAPADPRGGPLGQVEGRDDDSTSKAQLRADILSGKRPRSDAALLGGGGLSMSADGKGGFTVSLGGNGVLSKPSAQALVQDNIDLRQFQQTIGRLRDLSDDPTAFGAVGNVRRMVQGVGNQANALSQYFGGDFQKNYSAAAKQMAAIGLDPSYYDPKLDQVHRAANLAAYQAAAALANQSGRGLSDKDVKNFRQVLGDPEAWLESQQSFKAGLDQIESMVNDRLGMTNQNMVNGIDTSVGTTKPVPTNSTTPKPRPAAPVAPAPAAASGARTVGGVTYTPTGRTAGGKPVYKDPAGNLVALD